VILDAGDIVVSASSGPIIRPVSVSLEESYERPKGAKVTARVPLSGKDIPPSLDHLLARYDYLIAIDTNTQHIGDDFVSATGVVSGRQVSGSSNRHLVFRIRTVHCVEFWGVAADQGAEQIGWLEVLDDLNRAARPSKTVGLIVDSAIGSLDGINRREIPIYADTYLPKNMHMIYASSGSMDSLANKMLRIADKSATDLLRYVSKRRPQSRSSFPGKPYWHRCVWTKRNTSGAKATAA
jgi:hypothetical protein